MPALGKHRTVITASLALSLGFTFIPILMYAPQMARHRLFNDDCQIYLWIYHRVLDPDLFPGDPIRDYIEYGQTLPAFGAFYTALAQLGLHPLDAANLTSAALVTVFVCSVWLIGYRLLGPWWALLLVVLVISTDEPLRLMWGGLNRGFGHALLFLTLGLLICCPPGKEWRAVVSAVPLAFIYPFVLPFTFSAFFLRFAIGLWRGGRCFRRTRSFVVLLTCLLIHIALFGAVLLQMRANVYGPIVSADQAAIDPHWTGEKSRFAFPLSTWRDLIRFGTTTIPQPVVLAGLKCRKSYETSGCLLVLIALAGAAVIAGRAAIPGHRVPWGRLGALWAALAERAPEIVILPLVSVVFYIAARLLAFRLYFPYRYLSYTGPFVVSFLTLSMIWAFRRLFNDGIRTRRVFSGLGIVAVVLLFAFAVQRDSRAMGLTVRVTVPEERALQFIDTLPKEAVLFSPNKLADRIPLLARRSVLWNYETYQPLQPSYYTTIPERVRAGVRFLLANDRAGLRRFNVTHVVLQGGHVAPGKPFDPGFLISPVFDEYRASDLTYGFEMREIVYEKEGWIVLRVD